MSKGTIGETLDKIPEVRDELKKLFEAFGNLGNILLNRKAAWVYRILIMHLIKERERELGNIEFKGLLECCTTPPEEIKKRYRNLLFL